MELIAHCTSCLPRKKTRSIQTDGGVVYREYSYNCASQACQIAFDNHEIYNWFKPCYKKLHGINAHVDHNKRSVIYHIN